MTSSTNQRFDAVIVGAGLAGLSAAVTLTRAGRNVVILEAGDDVGGRVRSDHVDGFTLDRGFQILLTAYPEASRQLDLAALNLQTFDPGALVWHRGKGYVVADPFRAPRWAARTAVAPIGTPLDKLRIATMRRSVGGRFPERLLGGEDTSTIGALKARGFSDRMIERFLRPLFAGIQLDPQLTTSRRMLDIIFATMSAGDAAVPAAGMGAISRQLAAHLPTGAIRLNTAVVGAAAGHVTLADGTTVEATDVIVATEGPAAERLTGVPARAGRPVSCAYFAAPTAPTRHRLVVLDGESTGPVWNVAVMSNVAASYAPPGQHLIAAAMPGVLDESPDRALRQLRGWWGPQVDHWRHLRSYAIPYGQPDQSPPFSPKRSVRVSDGLWVCGDHRDTGSIQGALFSGRRTAEAVLVRS